MTVGMNQVAIFVHTVQGVQGQEELVELGSSRTKMPDKGLSSICFTCMELPCEVVGPKRGSHSFKPEQF